MTHTSLCGDYKEQQCVPPVPGNFDMLRFMTFGEKVNRRDELLPSFVLHLPVMQRILACVLFFLPILDFFFC